MYNAATYTVADPELELDPLGQAPHPHERDPASLGQSARSSSATPRLALNSQAPRVVRLHLSRATLRIGALVIADIATLAILRELLFGLRDSAWLGTGIAGILQEVVPDGALSSVQIGIAVLIGLCTLRNYDPGDSRRDASRLILGAGLGVLITLWSILWSKLALLAIPVIAVVSLIVGIVFVIERSIIDALIYTIRSSQIARAVVIGPLTEATQVIYHPVFGGDRLFTIAGLLDPEEHGLETPHVLAGMIVQHRVDTFILSGALTRQTYEQALDVAAASRCQVFALPRVLPTGLFEPKVIRRNGAAVVELTRPGLFGAHLIIKRLVDLTVVGMALPVLLPLYLVAALAVRRSSPGPILFRQTRIGQGGRHFQILKFRTMVADAEERRSELMARNVYPDQRLFKLDDDPRVTPIGRFLRKTSLDELPQLWNVIRGDMSLVGPRPPLVNEVALYEAHHYARFDVKPGITGPWQVYGRNLVRDFEDVIRIETDYIRNWSLALDIKLLLQTIPAVFTGRGAS